MSLDPPHQTARTRLSVSAALVGAGIFLSKIAGLVRITLFSSVYGLSDAADAFQQALRVPNFLQNLLGEGVLSASLIPEYSALMVTDRARADRMARAVLGVIAFITAIVVVIGITATPYFVPIIAGGYTGEKLELTMALVRIMFPGIGLLVLAAWCLAILNSHHRFFLSYAAPICWNLAIIAVLWVYRHDELSRLAVRLAWATVAGAALQLAIQAPAVWRLMSSHWTDAASDIAGPVRRVLISTLPVIFTRGVVQISGYIDSAIATWLGPGAVAGLSSAQQLSLLPVSLFGMAVSSASLPTMSTAVAANLPDALRTRLAIGQETIAALVVPSVVAFLALGDVMIAMLLEHGQFTHHNTLYVWAILAGASVGLLATTIGRLYVSTFYALGDTKTPTRIATFRVLLVGGLGYALALPVPRLLGLPLEDGCAGLTISAGISGWIEFLLLRRFLHARIGHVGSTARVIGRAWIAATIAAAIATGLRWVVPPHLLIVRGVVILGTFGGAYLIGAQWLGILDATTLLRRVRRRKG